jgi:hypothetical protein
MKRGPDLLGRRACFHMFTCGNHVFIFEIKTGMWKLDKVGLNAYNIDVLLASFPVQCVSSFTATPGYFEVDFVSTLGEMAS